MNHHRSPDPRRSRWPVILIGSLVMPFVGCTSGPPPIHFKNVRPVSRAGAHGFGTAKTHWVRLHAVDPQPGKIRDDMKTRILADLDTAVGNDPECPIFHGKRGEVYLEEGSVEQVAEGLENLKKAVELCEDWVPAWIALARVAAARRNLEEAKTYLSNAGEALRRIEENQSFFKIAPFEQKGLLPSSPTAEASIGPEPTREERLRLLLQWLVENESWRIDNEALPDWADTSFAVDGNEITRRLQARIQYGHYLVMRAGVTARPNSESEPAGWQFVSQLDRALKWDPNLFGARLEKARLFYARGLYREAKDLLYFYVVNAKSPLLRNNLPLVFLLASIYTDWYLEDAAAEKEINDERFDRANELFDRLHEGHPTHVASYEKQADLCLRYGRQYGKRDIIVASGAFLDEAARLRGKETRENQRRRAEIEKALAAHDGKETP